MISACLTLLEHSSFKVHILPTGPQLLVCSLPVHQSGVTITAPDPTVPAPDPTEPVRIEL